MQIPRDLTREHVLAALNDWTAGLVPRFRAGTTYDLLHDGKTYPPKAILAAAIERLTGQPVLPRALSGGEATNRVLQRLGFEVVRREEARSD